MIIINEKSRLIISAAGIFISYSIFGVLQEKVTRGRYGDELNEDGTTGERFTFTLALVGVQCFFNWLFARAILIANPQVKDSTHAGYYASCSLTYLLAMVSSNMALRWVSYPTQVVAKAAKPIPVMVLGVLIGRKSYPIQKYCFIFLIVMGVVLFMFKEGQESNKKVENTGLGDILLIMSLSMDGLTGAIQERMRASSKPTAQHMMLAMNYWSSLMLGTALLVTGEGKSFLAFAFKYPELFGHLASLALAGAIGQLFIFMMVSHFGPLPCSVVTTTRKFFTVLFSVMFFRNSLSNRQWFGAFLVFSGLFADMFIGKKQTVNGKKDEESKKLFDNDK
ncbi:CLUMA_CG010552, isoform A [Clunio marinus]|uniref:CLUMA_CG010552, isoform A n=1 Tax=Clunio marinus TaxID=568069 RepID=A0A1J1IAB1_9DIPT|nr:CLUMA_CG010552, isoform A [Clunio marinus]